MIIIMIRIMLLTIMIIVVIKIIVIITSNFNIDWQEVLKEMKYEKKERKLCEEDEE